MSKLDTMSDSHYIFGALFVLSNRIETVFERVLKRFNVTIKQWFLSIIVENMLSPPTISEVAKEMGSSHQNIKQIALSLNKKGLLDFEKDPGDNRAILLQLSGKSNVLWSKVKKDGDSLHNRLFSDISEDDLKATRKVIEKLLSNIEKIENSKKSER
ncbi:MAG: MarR family transcriptional regulator [Bacteroidota bacterium]|nr:MarR family transcriptional regulator [Bacteroidota bacterium]